eukprot:PITA_20808
MLAILHALKKWRPYLMGRHFKVKTDHDSLKYFLEKRLSSEEQQKWVTKMLGYDFEIIYKKGKKNVVADALSIKDEDVEALLYAISIIQPDWIKEAREKWKNDGEIWALIQKLQQDSSTYDTFSWQNDSLWYKDRLYLCKNSQLKQKILMELHTSSLGGHSRCLKTYQRVKKEFFWDGLKSDIQKFVVECLVCEQNKVKTIKTPVLLQPLSIPSQCWKEVSMDFITGLPKSEGESVIMLTQWVKWLPLAEWWYNTSFHTSTKITPFMALYGYQPPSITSYLRENSKVQAVEHHIEHQQQVLQLLKDSPVLAQNRMKQQVDQHRSERSFDVGDKLRVQTILPELDEEGKSILELEATTETRTQQVRNLSISEYLIKWKNLLAEDSTWEDDNFIQKHPKLLKH